MPEAKKMAVDNDASPKKGGAARVARTGNALAQVTMLDGSVLDISIERKATGKDLLDRVCEAINLIEKDYFGLIYSDRHDPRNWLDLEKRISKFMKCKQISFANRYPMLAHSIWTHPRNFLFITRNLYIFEKGI